MNCFVMRSQASFSLFSAIPQALQLPGADPGFWNRGGTIFHLPNPSFLFAPSFFICPKVPKMLMSGKGEGWEGRGDSDIFLCSEGECSKGGTCLQCPHLDSRLVDCIFKYIAQVYTTETFMKKTKQNNFSSHYTYLHTFNNITL